MDNWIWLLTGYRRHLEHHLGASNHFPGQRGTLDTLDN